MKRFFSVTAIITLNIISFSCNNHPADVVANKKHADILAQTFKTNDGWGYTVFVNDKLFIKQSYIPVITGNTGFANESDAIKVATLVVNKIKRHEKPTIRLEELQQCGIAMK